MWTGPSGLTGMQTGPEGPSATWTEQKGTLSHTDRTEMTAVMVVRANTGFQWLSEEALAEEVSRTIHGPTQVLHRD